MEQDEMLQYAKDNYSIGDKISRKGFTENNENVVIKADFTPSNNVPHFYDGNNSGIYLGFNQIYCKKSNKWAVNLDREQIISKPNYEVY